MAITIQSDPSERMGDCFHIQFRVRRCDLYTSDKPGNAAFGGMLQNLPRLQPITERQDKQFYQIFERPQGKNKRSKCLPV